MMEMYAVFLATGHTIALKSVKSNTMKNIALTNNTTRNIQAQQFVQELVQQRKLGYHTTQQQTNNTITNKKYNLQQQNSQ